jgi:non-specific serine/threonine protein kinase/serine/threonine-protein kinase
VLASPPSSLYRFGKFVHRHRTGTALVVTLVVAVIGYAVTMGVQARRIARERDRANAKAELARQERQSAEEVVDFLVKLFKVSNPGGAPDSTITARAVLDRGAEEIRRGLARQPVVRARLMNTMARVYFNLGIEGQARTLVEAALAARPDDPQHPDPVVAKSLTILGHLEVSQGRFSEARRLYERALAIWNATDAPDPLEAARVIENLATLRAMDGDMVQADSLHRRSLGILEQALGPNDPDVANVLHNIGVLRMSMGDNASAEQSFLRALAIEERALGPRSPLLASTLDNLGQLSMSTGDDDHARRYFTRALAIRESLFGDNLETSWSVSGLALLEAREGHRAEAERLHRRAQRIFTAEKHADTPEVLYFEASFAAVSGDRAEALHELQRALAEPGLSGLLLHDTNFASLQGDPTFEAMLSAARRGTAKQ